MASYDTRTSGNLWIRGCLVLSIIMVITGYAHGTSVVGNKVIINHEDYIDLDDNQVYTKFGEHNIKLSDDSINNNNNKNNKNDNKNDKNNNNKNKIKISENDSGAPQITIDNSVGVNPKNSGRGSDDNGNHHEAGISSTSSENYDYGSDEFTIDLPDDQLTVMIPSIPDDEDFLITSGSGSGSGDFEFDWDDLSTDFGGDAPPRLTKRPVLEANKVSNTDVNIKMRSIDNNIGKSKNKLKKKTKPSQSKRNKSKNKNKNNQVKKTGGNYREMVIDDFDIQVSSQRKEEKKKNANTKHNNMNSAEAILNDSSKNDRDNSNNNNSNNNNKDKNYDISTGRNTNGEDVVNNDSISKQEFTIPSKIHINKTHNDSGDIKIVKVKDETETQDDYYDDVTTQEPAASDTTVEGSKSKEEGEDYEGLHGDYFYDLDDWGDLYYGDTHPPFPDYKELIRQHRKSENDFKKMDADGDSDIGSRNVQVENEADDDKRDVSNDVQEEKQIQADKQWSKWRKVVKNVLVRANKRCNQTMKDTDILNKNKNQDNRVLAQSCESIQLQIKSCPNSDEMDCDATSSSCGLGCHIKDVHVSFYKQPSSATPQTLSSTKPTSSPTPSGEEDLEIKEEECQYSLYDTTRMKYEFQRWNLSHVLTHSKVKRWCKNEDKRYIIMSTPSDKCRQQLNNLCQASTSCNRSGTPPHESGDFADGCWRGLVYGDRLPEGLAHDKTSIYFICQRFAPDTSMGRTFGYKDTHYGTLYHTQVRAPIVSLHKIVQIGDETWPDTQFSIEHGLIDQKKDVMWIFKRHRKGMVTLDDLDRCYEKRHCDLGKYQTLPGDYKSDSMIKTYTPIPLIWPEWMDPSPQARISTMTMTNIVPLHTSLLTEWQRAVRRLRSVAVEHCGVPYVSDPNLGPLGQMSSHRANKSALYLASGSIPHHDKRQEGSSGIVVPAYLWVAGCCVHKIKQPNQRHINDALYDQQETKESLTKISSFSFHIKNEAGSHVIYSSVFSLEMSLLQQFYRLKVTDPQVSVFPGNNGACSDLKNDETWWVQNE